MLNVGWMKNVFDLHGKCIFVFYNMILKKHKFLIMQFYGMYGIVFAIVCMDHGRVTIGILETM